MSPTKAQRKKWAHDFPIYSWWVLAGVLGLLIVRRVVIVAAHYIRRRSVLARRAKISSEPSKEDPAAVPSPSSSAVGRTWTALGALAGKTVSYRDYGIGLWKMPTSELFWSISYTTALLVFSLVYFDLDGKTTRDKWVVCANRMGVLVYAQMPFVIGLASKNNTLSFLTGISYERLNSLHRHSARACVFVSWLHTFGRSVAIPLGKGHEIWRPLMIWGCVAFVGMNLMVILSFKPFLRRMAYEVFLFSHILFAVFALVGLILHSPDDAYWVWPSFVIWGFDRIVRAFRVLILNKLWLSFASTTNESAIASIESLGSSALRITVRRSLLTSWTPGQHAYLMCPSVSTFPLEAHPFTIASIPAEDKKDSELVFIVGVHDGFTRKLALNAAAAGGKSSVPCYFEGPYGNVKNLDSYTSAIFVAGGSGVTYTLPLLLNLVRLAGQKKAAATHITFVWAVRSVEAISWISGTLDSVRASCPSNVVLDIKIFVTRTSLALEEGASSTHSSSSDSGSIEISRLDAHGSNEDVVEGGNEKAGRKDSEFEHAHGRPDLAAILKDGIAEAKGEATSVTVCGPSSLSFAVKGALASWTGPAYKIKDVASGKVGAVDLHVESFSW